MKPNCPRFIQEFSVKSDPKTHPESPDSHPVVRHGSFFRKSDSKHILRFYCQRCEESFSMATLNPRYRQKKRRINPTLERLFCSGVSQRRASILLQINRKTVVRRFRFFAEQARIRQQQFIQSIPPQSLMEVQFDDLETSEHSKCKPLSVALAVDPKHRKILSFQVSQMPAKGRLVHLARRKYGLRKDERMLGWQKLMESLKPIVHERAVFTSDQNPHYPLHLKTHFKECGHIAVKGRRGCVAGQGELKVGGFDPLFALNHTCAMLRANLNRLFRRTWCTTKNRQGLMDHLSIYVDYHNRVLTPSTA